jgi:hypothetical protein
MGVSIGWRKKDPKSLSYIASTSGLHRILSDTYGIPCELSSSDIGFLKGLGACGHKGADELVGAINDHGEIIVDSEW